MTFSIFLTEEVYLDIKEAAQWYKEQKEGLQEEFIISFEQAIERIQINPLGHQLSSRKARYAMLHRFPYKSFINGMENKLKFTVSFMTSEIPN